MEGEMSLIRVTWGAGGMTQVVESLPSKLEVLSSNLSTATTKKIKE
jgi:hypothetical protein